MGNNNLKSVKERKIKNMVTGNLKENKKDKEVNGVKDRKREKEECLLVVV